MQRGTDQAITLPVKLGAVVAHTHVQRPKEAIKSKPDSVRPVRKTSGIIRGAHFTRLLSLMAWTSQVKGPP